MSITKKAQERLVARSALAVAILLTMGLIAFVALPAGATGPMVLAQATGSPTEPPSSDPVIKWLNPTVHPISSTVAPPGDRPDLSDKMDVDEQYHFVVTTRNEPANALVEAYYRPLTVGGVPLQEVTVGTFSRVAGSDDAWEFFWNIPEDLPEGNGELTVSMFNALGVEVAADVIEVEMRHKDDAAPPGGDGQRASDTVEITWPTQNGQLGFYKPRGGSWRGIVDLTTSDPSFETSEGVFQDPINYTVYYSLKPAGEAPTWKACGSTGSASLTPRVTCTLVGQDTPSQIKYLSAAVFEDQDPNLTRSWQEHASDAHLVKPYVQDPATMEVNLAPVDTPDTDGSFRETTEPYVFRGEETGEPNQCIALVALVTDHLGKEVRGANIDVHAIGPNDNIQFGDEDSAPNPVCCVSIETGNTSTYKVPDRAHSLEDGENCDRVPEREGESHNEKPVEGEQGFHRTIAAPDTIHRESAAEGSGLSGGTGAGLGGWTFAVYSPDPGFTDVVAWVDDEPLANESNERPADTDTHEPEEPSDRVELQWTRQAISVSIDPVSDSAAVNSCNRFTVKVRAGQTPIKNINVDVHAQGPNGDLDFCDPGDGTPRRAPDDTPTTPNEQKHQPEDGGEGQHAPANNQPPVQHTEGDTDDAGNFVFGIVSPVSGDTTITAWVDGEPGFDNDQAGTNEPTARATKSWLGSLADAQVSFVNPSHYAEGSGTKVAETLDADRTYHIVTRTDTFEAPGVELFVSSDGTSFTKIGDAVRAFSSDTWEFNWPVNVPDGTYTLRARITGTDKVEDIEIEVNHEAGTEDDPTDRPFETAEITRPGTNAESVAFTDRKTQVRGLASAGTDAIDVYYMKLGAKDTPQAADWIFCGSQVLPGTGTSPHAFSTDCSLATADQPNQVTGIAVATFDCETPRQTCAPAADADARGPGSHESGDAHRIFGFEGQPLVTIEPAESAARPGSCQRMVMRVTDETGQSIPDQNVDVHLTGPTDGASFCSVEGESPRSAPDQGSHTFSTSDPNEGIHQEDAPDTHHIEGATNGSGRFIFGVRSASEGDSRITGWVDLTNNDSLDEGEASTTATVHWGLTGGDGPPACTMRGNGAGNNLIGTEGDDVICAGAGRDTIRGRGGNDIIFAGDGADLVYGGRGKDRIRGGGGPDRLQGNRGNDNIRGARGHDRLGGGSGRDTCRGGPGRDRFRGCE